ncbi:MAG: indole-3-glycerol phosphate synthase TrpC [candidate division Zixibacteria bacterium]|nr:indole-3-glycerol phosphate synthase TrpC [candidate division Zixibacteria bacterium]
MNQMLRDIIAHKRATMSAVLAAAPDPPDSPRLPFRERLLKGIPGTSIIAEIKKGSPSRGVMVENFDPALIAEQYAEGGAVALSVLTDEKYFFGAAENVKLAKNVSDCPILCKDFFIDPLQMNWARTIGADAVLLIVRILSDQQLCELIAAANEAKLDVLVEVHNEAELERAQRAESNLIGVNNRDLETFAVDIEVSIRLGKSLPENIPAVAESGIRNRRDIERLKEAGYSAFLVGETLMMAENRVSALRILQGESVL